MNQGIQRLARELGLPLVVTNDAHYLRKEDAEMQDVLLCIQTGKTVDDTNRMKFQTQEFYLKSEDEMKGLFPGCEEAFENTVRHCRAVQSGIYLRQIPSAGSYPCRRAIRTRNISDKLCAEGFAERYPDARPKHTGSGWNMRSDMISQMGLCELLSSSSRTLSHYAKVSGHSRGAGARQCRRGFHCGILLCTSRTVDPMKYSLYFRAVSEPGTGEYAGYSIWISARSVGARSWNTSRRKYGADHVAQIVTFGTMAARGAIRDVGRALNFSYAETDVVAKLVPTMPLHLTLDGGAEDFPAAARRCTTATSGSKRSSIRPCVWRECPGTRPPTPPAWSLRRSRSIRYVPLSRNDDTVVTQYTMTTIEELGTSENGLSGSAEPDGDSMTRKRWSRQENPDFQIAKVPDDDPETYRYAGRGQDATAFSRWSPPA